MATITNGKSSNVALLAEGVDRNSPLSSFDHDGVESPSSRRAWIEIAQNFKLRVAEGVDRNFVADR